MSNITDKNTDANWTDFLPPALVKDWRQFLRSRGYIALFLLLQLVGWYFYIRTASQDILGMDDVENLRLNLFYFGLLVLCVIVPYRAGSSVSVDTKVRGTNFLMLTPLTARRIVWGTWCSSAMQVLLAAILALPLLYACRHLEAGVQHAALDWAGFTRDAAVLGLLTLSGWVAASIFMFTAGLARFFRIVLSLGVAVSVTTLFSIVQVSLAFGSQELSLASLTGDPLVFVDGIAVFVLLLELTRRHYAAPAENCSASVRLLSLLPLAVYLGLATYEYHFSTAEEPVTWLVEQGSFAVAYLLFALLSDALLPTYAMPVHARRAWRFLPSVLQVPGIVPSTLCLVLGVALCTLPACISGDDAGLGSLMDMQDRLDVLAVQGLASLNLAYTLLLWLLLTDMLCRRSNRNRPVVCGFVALVTFSVSQMFTTGLVGEMLLPLAGQGGYLANIFANGDMVTDIPKFTEAYIAGGIALAAVMALLIFWRGRVQKG